MGEQPGEGADRLVVAERPADRLPAAGDALAVMDALGWPDAHVVGASLGGMIAQELAIRHPGRVRTLTSIMSTPSARIATMPTIAAMRALARAAGTPATSPDQAAEQAVALKRVIGSPGYPPDEPTVRDIARRSFQRHPGAEEDDLRQRAAVIASRDRRSTLAGLRIPALVIHGDRDPVIRPKGGRATAAAIPGARLISYPGMGHDLPRPLWPSILDEICVLAERTKTPVTPPGSNQPQPAPNHPDDNGPAPEPGDLRAPPPLRDALATVSRPRHDDPLSGLQRVVHGVPAAGRTTPRPCLREGGIAKARPQDGQNAVVVRGTRHVRVQPATAVGLQHRGGRG